MHAMGARLPLVLGASTLIYATWVWTLDGDWNKATAASVGQGIGTFAAVATALWIGYQDRRDADEQARRERTADRETYVRRRDYDECLRLLQLVEADRRVWEERRNDKEKPRSVEATALVRGMWPRRNWWGTVWDWYVEYRQPNNIFSDGQPVPADVFSRMQKEIVEAIHKLDWQDRKPARQPPTGLHQVCDSRIGWRR